jgi:hypothetical protein
MNQLLSPLNNKALLLGLWLAEHPRLVQVSVALILVSLMLAAVLFPQHVALACPAGTVGSGAGGGGGCGL